MAPLCEKSQGHPPWLFSYSWEQRKLGEVLIGLQNNTLSRAELTSEQGVALNVHYGDVLIKFGEYLDVKKEALPMVMDSSIVAKYKASFLQNGDIIVADTAEDETVGKCSEIAGLTNETAISGLHTIPYRPQFRFASGFLGYYMNSNSYHHQLLPLMQGIKVTSISKSAMQNTSICYPKTEDEQAEISGFFRNLDHLIALHQRKQISNIMNGNISLLEKTLAWEQRKVGELADFNPKSELPDSFEYVDLESVVGTEMISHRKESRLTAPSRAQRLAKTGDLFYQTVRPYQKNNYLFEKTDENYVFSTGYAQMRPHCDGYFLLCLAQSDLFLKYVLDRCTGTSYPAINANDLADMNIYAPTKTSGQKAIGSFFKHIDHLIALHQRKYKKTGGTIMLSETTRSDLFCFYYAQWIRVYKEGAVRKVTMDKYLMTQAWLEKLVPTLRLNEVSRITYQQLLNDYAVYHERQTTMDFHHQLKGAIMDAVDDGFIEKDPTRKAIIKGKTPSVKKIKYLNQFELHTLLNSLNLHGEINWDWFIALTAKTGMRFSEVLALTPKDFDFAHQTLSICKTWDYKGDGGFLPTKNKSSVRKIQLDWQTVIQFSELTKALSQEKPIFVNKENVYNSTVNDILARHCKKAKIPVITVHGLRHTHASLLLFAGVSIASVARRLGHASMTTTQKTYLHIIQELENQDIDLVMRSLSGLN